jgi:ParB-like chromosome segregation protein Spo0J
MNEKNIGSLLMDINLLTPHPRNVRQGDIGAICESLKAHGQYRAIVFQKSSNQIIAGNHTWKAAKSLGWDQIAATEFDCDDETALRILLADNKASDLATYDNDQLEDLLRELALTEKALEGTLFDGNNLDEIINENEIPLMDEFPEYNENIDTQYHCPKCRYEWSGKAK